jgi:hypothetical protein
VREGVAILRIEKSQGAVTVYLPILPILQATLDAGPVGDLAFIVGKSGKPFAKDSFGNAFKEACVKAGLFQHSAPRIQDAPFAMAFVAHEQKVTPAEMCFSNLFRHCRHRWA